MTNGASGDGATELVAGKAPGVSCASAGNAGHVQHANAITTAAMPGWLESLLISTIIGVTFYFLPCFTTIFPDSFLIGPDWRGGELRILNFE
jgi:hypothetical protein